MRKPHPVPVILALAVSFCMAASVAGAQQVPAATGTPARLAVTVEPRHGTSVPVIQRDDVMVNEGHNRDTVTGWAPAKGEQATLELFVLIDDESSTDLGSQLDDVRKFINAQPGSTKIGVAYMQNGIARVVQDLTADHAQAANSLRLPMGAGGANASPYFSLSDLVKRWPANASRHEVLMVTDGIDRYYGSGDLADPYLQAAIDDSAKGGVIVSAIFNPGAGHFGHSPWETHWGQIYLSELAERTGGEAYYIGFTGAAVSFVPYLEDFGRRLENQYILTFLPQPQKKSGWQQVRLLTEVKGVDLVSAGRVFVRANE